MFFPTFFQLLCLFFDNVSEDSMIDRNTINVIYLFD